MVDKAGAWCQAGRGGAAAHQRVERRLKSRRQLRQAERARHEELLGLGCERGGGRRLGLHLQRSLLSASARFIIVRQLRELAIQTVASGVQLSNQRGCSRGR